MFTGLIETSGALVRTTPRGPGQTLTIRAPREMVAELTLGESVSTDGACLTVTRFGGDTFEVEASAETLSKTTLGEKRPGDPLHLERATKVGDRLGGHIVSGHVDATGTVASRTPVGASLEVWFSAPPVVGRYLIPKGSITIDGISLTVNAVEGGPGAGQPEAETRFSVFLIPHTQSIVHLHAKAVGARVNLEGDILGKYIDHLLAVRAGEAQYQEGGVSLELLARAGFLGKS